MPESNIGLPPDGAGKKLRTRSRTVGTEVHEQAVWTAAADTWTVYAEPGAFALNKHHITLFNAVGSGKVVRIKKLFAVNLQTIAVTGVVCRFDCKKATAVSVGTTVTPVTHDSINVALPAQITVRHSGTITEGPLLWPWLTQTDEETAVQAFSKAMFQQAVNIVPEGEEVQELVCREGEGFTVKQVTSTTVGTYGWILVFTCD